MISYTFTILSLLSSALLTSAQCNTAGYVPCLVPGANVAVPPPALTPFNTGTGGSSVVGGSSFWSSVNGAAGDPIQVKKAKRFAVGVDSAGTLEKRQSSLCCRPAPVECLYTQQNVPFCYVCRLPTHPTYFGASGTRI
jgi:hypothetical protein